MPTAALFEIMPQAKGRLAERNIIRVFIIRSANYAGVAMRAALRVAARKAIEQIVVANVAWSLILLSFTPNPKHGFLMSPTFYIFNALMFMSFLLMFQRYGEFLLWLTVRLVLAAVFIQVVMAFVVRSGHGRSTVMFNNPNQLGYYALLSACIILLGQKRRQPRNGMGVPQDEMFI